MIELSSAWVGMLGAWVGVKAAWVGLTSAFFSWNSAQIMPPQRVKKHTKCTQHNTYNFSTTLWRYKSFSPAEKAHRTPIQAWKPSTAPSAASSHACILTCAWHKDLLQAPIQPCRKCSACEADWQSLCCICFSYNAAFGRHTCRRYSWRANLITIRLVQWKSVHRSARQRLHHN